MDDLPFVSTFRDTQESRERLFNALLEWNEGRPIWVAQQGKSGRPTAWKAVTHYEPHAYRSVLHGEAVFDIGDNIPWEKTAVRTNALWTILTEHNIPFWGALSGGKGTHTHVFIEAKDYREAFVTTVMGILMDRIEDALGFTFDVDDHEILEETGVDTPHLNPPDGSKLIREFGVRKWYEKTLICSLENFVTLQLNRDDVYRGAASGAVPETVPVAVNPIGVRHRIVAENIGGYCPRNSECFNPESLNLDGFCDRCPTWW